MGQSFSYWPRSSSLGVSLYAPLTVSPYAPPPSALIAATSSARPFLACCSSCRASHRAAVPFPIGWPRPHRRRRAARVNLSPCPRRAGRASRRPKCCRSCRALVHLVNKQKAAAGFFLSPPSRSRSHEFDSVDCMAFQFFSVYRGVLFQKLISLDKTFLFAV